MAIDPQIALGVRPPQFDVQLPNPIQQYATVMSLRDMMTQNQLRQAQIAEAQQNIANQQFKQKSLENFRALYGEGQPEPTSTDIYHALGPDGTKVVQEMIANEKAKFA